MRFGINTPIVTLVSGAHEAWEETAGLAELTEIAQTADRLGYDFLTCSEHVAVPPGLPRGSTFWDPLATFSYLAGQTERIRFVPFVLIMGFYHPLELAKRYGTLDLISGGRLTLGLGVGNLREEFDMLGVPFDDRGERADDSLRALRSSLSRSEVSYDGTYYHYDRLIVDPHAIQARVPIWIGGHTKRSLRRAVEFGDGWIPPPIRHMGPPPATIADMVAAAGAGPGFDVLMTPEGRLDPIEQPEATAKTIAELEGHGATVISIRPVNRSLSHYLEQLEAFMTIAQQ